MVVTGTLTALETAYRIVYVGALIFLALMTFFCLIRLIYAMISFLAVIVLTKVYMGVHSEKKNAKEGKRNGSF